MDGDDAGAILGCLFVVGVILFKVGLFLAIVYVAYHFITKYW